jgi:hypothetical protein
MEDLTISLRDLIILHDYKCGANITTISKTSGVHEKEIKEVLKKYYKYLPKSKRL